MVARVVFLLLFAGTAHASAPEMFGMGARSGAMAGTGAADASGYDAIYENPAGLMDPTRRRLTLGYVFAGYRLQLDGAPRAVDDSNGVILGAAIPLPFGGVMRDRMAIGLGFYFPTSVLNRARSPYPDEPRLPLLDTRTQVVTALAGIAARLHPRLTIGLGISVLAALVGQVSIGPDASGKIASLVEEQILVAYTPIAGVRVRVNDRLRLGATFRGVSQAEYDIRIDNSLGPSLPLQLPTLRIKGVAQYDPMQLAVEGAVRARPWLSLSGGLTWKRWSAYPRPSENATAGADPQPEPGFHDTVVPRIAVEVAHEVRRVRLSGRAGYFFEWSPAPAAGYAVRFDESVPAQGSPSLVDADRHVVTVGGGLEWNHRYGVLQVDLFGQWHQLAGSSRATGGFGVVGGTIGVDL